MPPATWTAILNTIEICVLVCLLAVPLGTVLAIALHRTNVWLRQLGWIAICSQIAVPLYVFAGGWCAALGTQGWLPAVVPFLSMGSESVGSVLAVSLIHATASVPWVVLVVSLGLRWSDRGEEEVALLEGGVPQLIYHVVLPRLRIWIVASCLWCCYPVLTEMVVTNLYQVPSVAELIYLDASLGTITLWTYLVAGLLCTAPLLVAAAIWSRFVPPMENTFTKASHFESTTIQLGAMRVFVSILLWCVLGLLVGLPILSLVAKAGWTPALSPDGLTSYGWSAGRFFTTVAEGATLFPAEFYWSGTIGTSTATTAVILAAALFWMQKRVPLLCRGIQLAMLVTMCVPGPMVGILLVGLFNRNDPAWLGLLYDQTIAVPVIAQLFRALPLAVLLAFGIAFSIDRQTREQLQSDGNAGALSCLRILGPQIWPLVLSAWLLLFALSVGSLSCSILVLPPGVTTVAMRLFEMLHFGMRHQDSALCGAMVILGWVVALLFRKTLSAR